MAVTVYRVEGMTCDHCVKAVKEEVGAIAGVTQVEVDLAPDAVSTLSVTSDGPLDLALVAGAVAEAGYQLAS